MSRWIVAATLLLAALSATPAAANPGDIRVTFMASRAGDWWTPVFSGSAFVCFEVETADSSTDDCYAFYQKENGTAFAGGSRVSKAELRKTPSRFANPTSVISRKISEQQVQAVLKLFDTWNEREYHLEAFSATELARDVAQATGFIVPPRKKESSDDFLKRLKNFNT